MNNGIQLTKSVCGSGIFGSKCGMWITNGHWTILANHTKKMKSTPVDAARMDFDYDRWLIGTKGDYRKAALSRLTINGSTALVEAGTSNIIAWIAPEYEHILDLGNVWACDEKSPVMITAGDRADVSSAVAWVMPRQSPVDDETRELLKGVL